MIPENQMMGCGLAYYNFVPDVFYIKCAICERSQDVCMFKAVLESPFCWSLGHV